MLPPPIGRDARLGNVHQQLSSFGLDAAYMRGSVSRLDSKLDAGYTAGSQSMLSQGIGATSTGGSQSRLISGLDAAPLRADVSQAFMGWTGRNRCPRDCDPRYPNPKVLAPVMPQPPTAEVPERFTPGVPQLLIGKGPEFFTPGATFLVSQC